MPGSIQNAAPTTVLPQSLSRAFVRSQEYPVIENEYRNGESQRSVQAWNSRKRWRLAKRLAPAQLQALCDFYDCRNGPTDPFYFYDPYETVPRFSWDEIGAATTGRYTVRFDGDLGTSIEPWRSDISIALVELA